MRLIRHNRLVAPYDRYETLSLTDLDALATDAVSPDIQPLPVELPFGIAAAMREASYVVCSQSLRTRRTCDAVLQTLGLERPCRVDPALNEIAFRPSGFVGDEGISSLQAVRDRMYPLIATGHPAVENRDALQGRIRQLFDTYAQDSVVLFGHGFLMKLVKAVSMTDSFDGALELAGRMPSVDYLELVEITAGARPRAG